MESLLVTYVGGSLLLALLSLPLIWRKVKPNPFYGFRVSQTLADSKTWYETNSYAGKRLLAVAIIFIASAVGLYLIPGIGIDIYALACLGVFVVVSTIAIVQTMRYMKTLGD